MSAANRALVGACARSSSPSRGTWYYCVTSVCAVSISDLEWSSMDIGAAWTMAVMIRRRMVATEFGICRSGRKGGASGSVTVGYGKLPEQRGATRS
jgi:hypothetical protein